MSNHSKEFIEQQCMDDYREHEGKILLVNLIHGYVDDNSHEFQLKKPVRVQVVEHQRESDMLNWTAPEWCDPNWDVELLETHEELDMASSFWVDGISRNIDGTVSSDVDWELDPDQSKPAPEKQQQEPDAEVTQTYQKRAREFCKFELDENDWDIDDEPLVSIGEDGAYVMMWRWFPAEKE